MTEISTHPARTRPSSVARPVGRRQLAAAGGGLALCIAAAFALRWWSAERFMIRTNNAYVKADVVTIAPFVSGNVAAVTVADNQAVRAGELLARIDDRAYHLKVKEAEGAVSAAEAGIAAQQARLGNIAAQIDRQRSVIAEHAAAVAAGESDTRLTDAEYRRQLDLSRQQVTSAKDLESARAQAQKAAAGLAAERAKLAGARQERAVLATADKEAAADLDKARGYLLSMQAQLAAARLDLEWTAIRAPVSGRVGERTVRSGQYAEAGTPLMALVPKDIYVVANYKEIQTGRIRPGQPAAIAVDALGGATLEGHVDSFAPASGAEFAVLPPDNATGNFTKIVQRIPLRIRVDPGQSAADQLRPGMSVETTVDTRGMP